jgi:hypothetical protein
MGDRPRSPGFIQSISKAQLKVVGLLDAAGNPIAGGGGLPAGYDVEVEAAGNLSAALAANNNVYVSGNITISATITISGNKRILFANGVVVTCANALAGNAAIAIPTGTTLAIDSPGSYTLLSQASHTGGILQGTPTGYVICTGRMLVDISAAVTCKLTTDLLGTIEHVEFALGDFASYVFNGDAFNARQLTINYLLMTGAGTSTSIVISDAHIQNLVTEGAWRTVTAGSLSSTFAIQFDSCTIDKFMSGATLASGIDATWKTVFGTVVSESAQSIHLLLGDNSVALNCRSTVFAATENDADTQNNVFGPGTFSGFSAQGGGDSLTMVAPGFSAATSLSDMKRCRIIGGHSEGAITLGAQCDNNDIVAHSFNSLTHATTSTNNRYTNCYFEAQTVTATSYTTFVNCFFSSTLTVNAGANATFIGCQLPAAVTNNDGLASKFIGCMDATGLPHHANNDGRIVYDSTATTDATQTELLRDGTARFTLPADTTAIVNIKILAQRDNQDWASFQWLGAIIANDGGAYTATNVTASAGPDHSKGTGSSLVIALDASSGLRIRGTANAAENWKWQTEIEFVTATN